MPVLPRSAGVDYEFNIRRFPPRSIAAIVQHRPIRAQVLRFRAIIDRAFDLNGPAIGVHNYGESKAVLMFRVLLVALLATLTIYTTIVISNHGWNLLAVFFGDMAEMTWPGQFNLDFTGFLILSALWTAWRHQFSPAGLALGIVAFFGGMMFLTIYLLAASYHTKGNMRALLLGPRRL